jgi:fructoselysine-6-P-deglycase FrlB-like protein
MTELTKHVEAARQSTYFSGARLADDLGRFLEQQAVAIEDVGSLLADAGRVYLVGSGGSLATLQAAKLVLDRLTGLATEALTGYELIWRDPAPLGAGAVAVFSSYSGETADTLAAFRLAKERGARTVALVNTRDCSLGREADLVIAYESAAIFEAPLAALTLAAVANSTEARNQEAAGVKESLMASPQVIRAAVDTYGERAEADARRFLNSHHMYVLGAGPLAPLAYKVALTVVMENIRIGGTYCDAMEFNHGPAEALERSQMDAMVLLGTDASRPTAETTLAFLESQGARTLVFDAAAYGEIHPLLTPLLLNSLTQWFVVYSAILRGITDLDARVFMGHGVLSDAPWP